MTIQSPIVLASGFFSQLFPGDTVPGTDTTAQASGNAALVLAGTALASGNAGISTGLTALASGNAGLVSASNKVPISGGYMTGQLFAASGVVVSGTLSRNGFNVVTVGDVETVTSTMIASGTIIDADVNISGAINATKLNFLQVGASGVARTVDSKLKDVVSVKDFGAVGDGITNDTVAIQAAINSGANTIYLPGGTYIVTQDGSSYALKPLSNQKIIGAGRGATIIKLANNQGSFSRIFGVLAKTNVTIQSLTVDGNKANQTAGYEQQHGIFINASSNVLVIDVQVKETRGDNIYWYGNCQNCSVVDSWLQTTDRICIHAQIITNCVVSNTHFYVDSGSCGIKCELDGEGLGVDGLTVTGCTFDGATTVSGIIISGFSATTKSSNIAVTGCLFNGLLSVGINIGIYSTNWNISGNVFAGIEEAIVQTSYSTVYGYSGQSNITISNNTCQGLTGTSSKFAIFVSNCTNLIIANNTIQSSTLPTAIAVYHSTGIHFSNNVIQCSNAGAGISLYRCQTADINDNTIAVKTTGVGIYVESDVTYPSTYIRLNGNTMLGAISKGIDVNYATAGTVYIQNTWAPQATTALYGYYTSSPPSAGTWQLGDIIYDASPSASDYVGWVCVTAGTPGTWKTFGAISA